MPKWTFLSLSPRATSKGVLSVAMFATLVLVTGCSGATGSVASSSTSSPAPTQTSSPSPDNVLPSEESKEEYIQFCYNAETGERADEEECKAQELANQNQDVDVNHYHSSSSNGLVTGFLFGYMLANSTNKLPPVGQVVDKNTYTTTKPSNSIIHSNLRGNFGSTETLKKSSGKKTDTSPARSSGTVPGSQETGRSTSGGAVGGAGANSNKGNNSNNSSGKSNSGTDSKSNSDTKTNTNSGKSNTGNNNSGGLGSGSKTGGGSKGS